MVEDMKAICIETIREQLEDAPRLLAWFEANVTTENETTLRELVATADASPFSLREWIESLMRLRQWLQARRLRAGLEDQVGYVGCACASVAGPSVDHSLPVLVEEMLADYGFERASPEPG